MPNAEADLAATLVRVVRETLVEGLTVELDGLGSFCRRNGQLRFIPETAPRVFIAYVDEEAEQALRLADSLEAAGIRPWIDKRKLMPGQDWRRAIDRAIARSDFFVACFSPTAVRKRGQFPYEIRYALRCADRMPLDDTFVMPVRLAPCQVPRRIEATTQYLDLFPDWECGVNRLVKSIWSEFEFRGRRAAA